MKKMIAILFVLLLTISTSVFAERIPQKTGLDSMENDPYTNRLTLLRALGICNGEAFDEQPEQKTDEPSIVSRGEFVMLSVCAANAGNVALSCGVETIFADVDSKTPYFEYINYAAVMGWVVGKDYGRFDPYAAVTADEAEAISKNILGYGKEGKINVLDGVSEPAITRRDAVNILFNVLNEKPLISESITEPRTSRVSSEIQLNVRFEAYKESGLITAGSGISMYSGDDFDEHTVTVNGLDCIDECDAGQYLGMRTEYYYRDDSNGNRHIIACFPKNDARLMLLADDIDSFENRTYSYTENNKRKTAVLADNHSVIYNQKLSSKGYYEEKYRPASGYVVLIDNDGDRQYDLVQTYSFSDRIVKGINAAEERIIFYSNGNSDALSLTNKEYACRDFNGKEIKLSDIKSGDALSVLISEDEERLTIYASSGSLTGSAVEMTDDEITVLAEGEDKQERVSVKKVGEQADSYGLSDVVLNAYGKFYKNRMGKLFAFVKVRDGEYKIGFAIAAAYNDADDRAFVKILDADGEIRKYSMADRPTVSAADKNDPAVRRETRVTDQKALYQSFANGESVVRKPVMFCLNKNGEINKIMFPTACSQTGDNEDKSFKGDGLHYFNESAQSLSYNEAAAAFTPREGTKKYGDFMFISPSITWFKIPSVHGDIEDKFAYRVGSIYPSNDIDYTVQLFSSTGDSQLADIGISISDNYKTINKDSVVYGVQNVYDCLLDDMVVAAADVISSSGSATYYAEDRTILEDVHQGDIIRLAADSRNVLTVVEHLISYDKEKKEPKLTVSSANEEGDAWKYGDGLSVTNNPYMGEKLRLFFGGVYQTEQDRMTICRRSDFNSFKSAVEGAALSKFSSFYVYTPNEGWKKGTKNDIYDYKSSGALASTVFFRFHYAEGKEFYIYNY